VEDIGLNEARYQFEVNLFGAARVTQLLLPAMRKRAAGTIVNITSMGVRSTPRSVRGITRPSMHWKVGRIVYGSSPRAQRPSFVLFELVPVPPADFNLQN